MKTIKTTEISQMDPNTMLDPDAPLFKALQDNPPKWWLSLIADPEIYIEIRKGNIIHVYYYGARIAEIDYKLGTYTALCHNKYITGRSDAKDGYNSCLHLLENNMTKLKKNASIFYLKDVEGEDTSEKRIQGRLRLDNDYRYIDSEFAHHYQQTEKNSTIRFDLVAVDDNVIRIEELKRVGDNRLRTSDMVNNPPEVLEQMKRYSNFMSVNKDALCCYYQTLIKIKAQLGLPTPMGYNREKPLTLELTPLLLIKNLYRYSKMSMDRFVRIKDIRQTLEENNIKYYILP